MRKPLHRLLQSPSTQNRSPDYILAHAHTNFTKDAGRFDRFNN